MSDVVGQIALELGIDSSQIVNQLTGASNKAAKQATSIFSGMGKKIAGALSIAAFAKFTKDCIEVGSNVTEVQNVVDTAFGDLSHQADLWASNAMTNFGLSELSAKKYMGVFGQMSNAMGITGQAALDMAEDVTGLTGDVASFYNLSTDEAYTKLKSIWTGETETLKDLGVVMTQTNLDQYALNNGFGKTTAKMTEQEKVMLQYQYVTSALSNATGDFVKTQDSWANQTRILSLRFEQLKASLGKGFIALFTPILRGLNTVLAGLQKVADGFATFTQMLTGADISSSASSITGLGDIASDTADNVSGIGDAASSTAKQIEKSLAGFDQIEKLSEPTDSSSSSGGGTSSGGLGIDTGVTSETTNVSSAISDMASKVKKALEPLKSISFDNLITSLDNLKESAQPLTEKLFSGLEWAWTNIFVPLATWTIEDALPAFLDVLSAGLDVLNSALDALKPLWDWAWDNFLEPVAEWTGGMIVDILKDLAAALEGISTWISNNQGPFDAIVVTILAFAAAWKAVELAEFITNAGGVIGIIKSLTTTLYACTIAKVADKAETLAICALYAKDFIVGIGQTIAKLASSAAAWVADTAAKVANTAATAAHTVEGELYGLTNAVDEGYDADGNWVGYNYATDPQYYSKCLWIVNEYGLRAYNDYVWSVVNSYDDTPEEAEPVEQPDQELDEDVIDAIYRGEYGNDPERRQNLEAAGYNYADYQAAMEAKYYPKDNTPAESEEEPEEETSQEAEERVAVVEPGGSFCQIARDYLGDEGRAAELAEHNGMTLDDMLYAGMELRLPN